MESWSLFYDRYYRRRELYEMFWGVSEPKIDFNKVKLIAGKFGGPVAVTRDDSKILMLKEQNMNPTLDIYTAAGKRLSQTVWDKGRIVKMGWTETERLVIVLEDGVVLLYSVFGELLRKLVIEGDCKDRGVLDAVIWETGLVCLSKGLKFYALLNLEDREPSVIKLKDPNLQEPPLCWTVIEPKLLASLTQQRSENSTETLTETSLDPEQLNVEVLLAVASGTVLVVSRYQVTDMLVKLGPLAHMSLSPSAKHIACVTQTGVVHVVTSDFAQNVTTFDPKTSPPHQLAWCGGDAVACYWEQGDDHLLLLIGPYAHWLKFTFDEPIHLVSEIDGLRIISSRKSEFLHRVPNVAESVLKTGSTSSGAMLLSAWDWFQKRSAKADDTIRNGIGIGTELAVAVDSCIETAAHEFDLQQQRRLMKAAAYGKAFLDFYSPQLFVETARTLRVLNAVRYPDIGIPLTYLQYKHQGPHILVQRLTHRHHHLLALRICEYLQLKVDDVLIHWASTKVRRSSLSDEELAAEIVKKLKPYPSISYAEIARTAYKVQRPVLAALLLEHDMRPNEQVPLLLGMNHYDTALSKAVQSGDTDLIYLVLFHLRRHTTTQEFLSLLSKHESALNLYLHYCKEYDLPKLKELHSYLHQNELLGHLFVREAYSQKDPEIRREKLQQALSHYRKSDSFAAKVTEEQISLLLLQRDLEVTLKTPFRDSSLSSTIYRVMLLGDHKRAYKIKSEFKVPDKRFWWLRVRALGESGDWEELERFSKEKKSPIGYAPFAEVCLAHSRKDEALKYIPRIADPSERAQFYLRLNMYHEAIISAKESRDVSLLQTIRAKCTDPSLQRSIDTILQQLSKE